MKYICIYNGALLGTRLGARIAFCNGIFAFSHAASKDYAVICIAPRTASASAQKRMEILSTTSF